MVSLVVIRKLVGIYDDFPVEAGSRLMESNRIDFNKSKPILGEIQEDSEEVNH